MLMRASVASEQYKQKYCSQQTLPKMPQNGTFEPVSELSVSEQKKIRHRKKNANTGLFWGSERMRANVVSPQKRIIYISLTQYIIVYMLIHISN